VVKLKKYVTLVTEKQAYIGHRYRVIISSFCKKCKLYRICVGNLKENIVYEVVNVRRKTHLCPYLGVKMKVVEVIERPTEIIVKENIAVEGVTVRYSPVRCKEKSCRYHKLCGHPGFSAGEKIRIIKVYDEQITCRMGYRLRKVLVVRE